MGLFDIIRNLFKEQEEPAPPKFNSNMGKLKCKHCGGTIPENADYCPYCGFYIRNTTGWTCPHCGASNPANTTTCRYCGNVTKSLVPVETPEFLKQGGRLSEREINEQREIEKIRAKEAEKERKIEEQRLKRLEKIETRERQAYAKSSSSSPISLTTSGHTSSSQLPPNPPDSLDNLRTLLKRGNQQTPTPSGRLRTLLRRGKQLPPPPPPDDGGPPSGANIKCRGCGEWFDESLPDCPHCGAPNDRFRPNLPPPPPPPVYRKTTPLSQSAGKSVKGKLYEFLIFEILGILSLVVPPFFGFPQLTYLAIAFMAFIPLYMAMPSEHHYLESLSGDAKLDLPLGSLMAKAMFKITALSLIILQFFTFPIFRIICVIISLIFYFSLHTRYKTSQPYRMIEAWYRMGLGIFIAFILSMTFGGFGPGALGSAFFFVGIAFFFTFPIHIEDEEGVIKIEWLKKVSEGNTFKIMEAIMFLVFMIAAIWSFSTVLGGATGTSNLIFYVFWFFALITGLVSGPEGRPAMGIIMIFLMMFILTTSYTGYVGQAVFGYWWPQISNFASTFMGPLNTALTQAQNGLGDVWLMMTNPQQYYLNMEARNKATKSVITTGGTSMSIEISKFELTPMVLEPSEPVIGVMELQNSGDFISGTMNLDIWATYPSTVTQKEYATGEVDNLVCSVAGPAASYTIVSTVNTSTVTGTGGSCLWNNRTYPTETRAVTFDMAQGDWWGPLYQACQDNSNSSSPEDCNCFGVGPFSTNCKLDTGNITYYYSGRGVKVYSNLTYQYVVNVSLPVSVIGFDEYLRELQTGDITLQDFTSEYTGGPVKATLFTQKQPARNDIPFIVMAAIYNDGSGELLNVTKFKIKIYGGNMVDSVSMVGFDFRRSSITTSVSPDGCDAVDSTSDPGNFIITCQNLWKPLKPGEYKRVSFYVHTNKDIIDKRTTLIVGQADYTYRKTTSQMLTMANAPPQ